MFLILKSERKQIIVDRLSQDNFVTLDALVDMLGTSESTVRRDLDELENEKKLKRVHGGAERAHSLQEELSNLQKSIKNVQEKAAIAQKAGSLIEEADVIFIDAGTTTELLLQYLQQKELTVVTNSIHHASKLVENDVKTLVIGGFVKNVTDASIGRFAIEQIHQLNFDKAFIGMNGVDESYFTTPDIEEAAVKKAIMDNADQVFVLADASKLDQTSFVKVDRLEMGSLITNRSNSPLVEQIKKKTKVIEV